MSELKIPANIFGQMVAQANAQAPVEACGILAGKDNMVVRFYEMTNADNSNDHFMMGPKEQFAVVKDIRSSGLELLAIYHSHPVTPARPSPEDIRLALTPNVVYVIVSLRDSSCSMAKGFLIEYGAITEVPVKVLGK